MAQKPRIEFAGAVYPIRSRRDQGENIYHDEEDPKGSLRCLGQVCDRNGWKIHAFVLRYKAFPNCDKSCLDQPKIENGDMTQAVSAAGQIRLLS